MGAFIGIVIYKNNNAKFTKIPEYDYYNENEKMIEFSVDDATEIFWTIYNNPQYESIFDEPRMKMLKDFHEEYDADVTLFLYEELYDWNMDMFPTKYKREFKANADWLKLGWHAYNENNPSDYKISSEQMIESFERTYTDIIRFAGDRSLAKELRLHYWYGDSKLMNYLAEVGIDYIYYPDRTDVVGYDFSEQEDALIRKEGILTKKYCNSNITYIVTDCRLENETNVIDDLAYLNKDRIVVFTHAWILSDNLSELDSLGAWANKNGYSLDYYN